MQSRSLLACTLSLLVCVGCSKHHKDRADKEPERKRIDGYYEIEVISEPPGARIELNNDYLGDTPITIRMKGNRRQEVERDYVLRALPIHPGHFTQVKVFRHYEYIACDTIPERVFFDMRLERVRDNAHVDINVRDQR